MKRILLTGASGFVGQCYVRRCTARGDASGVELVALLESVDIRGFARDKHRTVDDSPFGGGAGMVMRADVAAAAIDSVEQGDRPRIYLSPRGKPLTQQRVRELAAGPGVIVLCGRFEGLDERVIDKGHTGRIVGDGHGLIAPFVAAGRWPC